MYAELEAVLAGKIEEHELLETQFTTEHEEEVRALRQQKRHIMKKLEEVQEHYQNVLDGQEQQVSRHEGFALFKNNRPMASCQLLSLWSAVKTSISYISGEKRDAWGQGYWIQ